MQQGITLSPHAFYTLSFYAREEETSEVDLQVYLTLVDAQGDAVDLSGYSYGGDCTRLANIFTIGASIDESEWTRYSCTFTTADETTYAEVSVGSDENIFFDAIQLEYGENANDFVEGYNDNTLTSTYLIAPPDYLGCEGDEDDPSACDNYAQVCASAEAGCLLYTPQDGDPSVPAILSSSDECPDECVGYTTYKQESTLYDSEEFPLYFIEDRAVACTEQYAGCESFTNLSAVETGGETAESYTYLRPCLTEEMSDGTSDKESSTFFTWEGSDVEGYQLRTWQLLESNGSDSATLTFVASAETEQDIGQAPCTQWNVTSETTIACDDITGAHLVDIARDDTCDQHDDIFENPDCREFFDSEGKVHYRLWSQTISVTDACVAYRLDNAEQLDCEDSGGYWTSAGACRYFGFSEESTQCPVSSVGCREYTGGAGRNASTVFSDTFEDGDVAGYETTYAISSLSNESVATDGHSLKIVIPPSITLGYVKTLQSYAVSATPSTIFDSTDATSCTSGSIVGSFCEIDADGDGTVDCSIEEADNSCGTLDDTLVEGKTFVLSFWAKGNGNLYVELVEAGGGGTAHDFVDATDATVTSIALDGSWQLYELGPLDTSDFTDFDDSAVLRWSADANVTFYLDNISLKQAEENITLIKDSWVVPSTCDQTPTGVDADQYYLGCEAYTDSEGEDAYAYQFSDLCREDAVGCKAFYDTQESDSEYTQVFSARCENHTAGDPADPVAVSSTTNCVVDGVTYCAITTGRSYCLFDFDGSLPVDLPSDSTMSVILGPEAVVVTNDTPRHLIESDSMTCSDAAVGCQELGFPTYSQDKTEVTEFTSVYFINDPESYGDILCDDEALFCEAWTGTEQGTYYYKDPVDQTCTYETEVTVGSVEYSGWFRSDAQEPCYWTDVDGDEAFTSADTAYLISGTQAGIWRNGDDAYVGWVAECKSTYDLCSEFIDPMDVAAGLYEDGMSYYYLDDEELDESTLRDSERCSGKVSQKEGCALFLNTTDSELSYNASASYMASAHADEFFSDEADSLQDPIDCEGTGGGVVTTADGTTSYDLCARRCVYTTQTDDAINSPMAMAYTGIEVAGTERFMERSCYTSDDCIDLQTTNGETVAGVCTNTDDLCSGAMYSMDLGACDLTNDTNTILKVDRDRACAAWLSCSSSQVSWDETSSTYQTICNDVSLCSEYTAQGDSSFCDEYISTQADVLTPAVYAQRDTSWNGWDYAGYAIAQQLPIEHYGQFNIAPTKWCVSSEGYVLSPGAGSDIPFDECSEDSDCASGTCEPADDMYRLSYVAGTCDTDTVGTGGTCYVGACADDGSSCSSDDECDGSQCVVGYCQVVSDTDCSKAADCAGVSYGGTLTAVCDTLQGTCVDALVPNSNTCVETSECSASAATCTLTANTYTGSCFSEACLTDIRDANEDGIPDPFDAYGAREKECRGYPEATSPYSASQETGIVESWISDEGSSESTPSGLDSRPYTLRYGFQSADVCAPITNVDGSDYFATDDCTCSYKKASYSDGAAIRYYSVDYAESDTLPGVCLGGDNDGLYCDSNDDCSDIDEDFTGICGKRSQLDTYYGWEGYCLEKDTSIQIFGSSAEENRACLTWLPVDQLVGSTDLYGKYTEAGYDDGDTYYCADISGSYSLRTTASADGTGLSCAETVGVCDDGHETFGDFLDEIETDGDCLESVLCPDGYFGVMTGCGGLGYDTTGEGDADACTVGNDDCSYFCVPKGSFHTDTGEPCQDPGTEGEYARKYTIDNGMVEGTSITRYEWFESSFEVYMTANASFIDLLSAYDDCEVSGVTDSINDFLHPYTIGDDFPSTSYGSNRGYYNFNLTDSIDLDAACTSLVQVAVESDYINKAWTNRVWNESNSPDADGYIINDASTHFTYPVSLEHEVFGKLGGSIDTSGAGGDGQPAMAVTCEDETDIRNARSSITCAERYAITGDGSDDAWPYLEIATSEGFYMDTTYCLDSDCACEQDTVDVDCNSVGGVAPTCSSSTCDIGPNMGDGCDDDSDCLIYECIEVGRDTGETGVGDYSYPVYGCGIETGRSVVSSETESAAISRLAQIFAESYLVYSFDDGYSGINDLTVDAASSLGHYGRYGESSSVSWIWEDLMRGDDDTTYTSFNPEPPVVISVGDCSGTVCEEGEEDAFSVNEQDQGEVRGAEGNLHATARFYTSADENQMPIRTILVDWADDETGFGTYSGSTADDNFYKNHRGVRDISNPVNQCSAGADTWDLYSDACDSSYVAFTHDYVCSEGVVSGLESCDQDEEGNVTNSPCVNDEGACVFRPRVFVQDNWGWCTGVCDAGLDGTSGCYEDESIDTGYEDECDWENCPGGTRCGATSGIDPWVYFDGEIVVEP
ncbi:MAG: hypothetical protein UX57_C0008G0007 [Candidatus Uhrbacteria bacterium GW2011_GWE2_46_68]|uniref:Uncharacterized protein n=1 Tax=Candidatus Uhrbacteria bacterium GW2011_GWE2_46_68 TaxID=1618994 RepID=A0A0G1T684_9BACT|nr:MAG: hypothetical protein UX57_C0008G0007 [Candidatus Uhrbacteria bacterium GW2011_GWE2_46_68]